MIVKTAVILRVRWVPAEGRPRTWYEFAPVVNGRPKRRPDHMMASAESAARRAQAYGFETNGEVVDYETPAGRTYPVPPSDWLRPK